MREIKFRAWVFKDNRMLQNGSFHIHLHASGGYGISHKFYDEEEQFHFTRCKRNNFDETKPELVLMQYTGLKDKNGKEIYEGDAVYGLSECGNHWGKGLVSFKVPTKGTYFNPQFIAEWIEPICSDDELRQIRLDAPASLEVIGNIYQNPELLEGKKDE